LQALQESDMKAAQAQLEQGEERTRRWMLGFAAAAIAIALAIAYAIVRHIVAPLRTMTEGAQGRGRGDFTRRVGLERSDEYGTLAGGFDRMSEELTRLVAQVQNSSRQVSESVLQIAGTAQQQQATATEIAATTTEIGATSREISATSK